MIHQVTIEIETEVEEYLRIFYHFNTYLFYTPLLYILTMIFILFVQVCPWNEWRRFRGICISTTRSTISRSQLNILISILTNRIFSLLPSFFFFFFHAFATINLFFFSLIFLVYTIPFNIYLFCYQSPILYQNIIWS